nr:MAG TPA: hypothetical protein [Bacteriophage sp.]
MNNQNTIIEGTVDNGTTQRCINLLKELVAVQEKAMKFLVSEGIDDSLEGEAIADGLGSTIRAFDGILPEGIYNKTLGIEV